jgi:hypothetical protein
MSEHCDRTTPLRSDHTGQSLAKALGDPSGSHLVQNPNGGHTLTSTNGALVSYDDTTAPFPVYGKIFSLWRELGGVKSGLGHPIADPQFLPHESTCIIFGGGHIHQIGKKNVEM